MYARFGDFKEGPEMKNKILLGSCLEVLKTLPNKIVNTCVTSPPYFGLRDYEVDGQLGLEETPDEYVKKLVLIFREVKRVLRDDGTLWLNLGDSYTSNYSNNGGYSNKSTLDGFTNPNTKGRQLNNTTNQIRHNHNLKPKNLIGIPWKVAFALQADGWYLRQDIIWHKPNPMPESVKDRCTKSHEYIFLLSKNAQYHYDYEAIKEPVAGSTITRCNQDVENQEGSSRIPGKTNGKMKAVGSIESRNKRDVWTVATKPYTEAHFAVFPEELIQPCILAGCPESGIVLDPFGGSGTTGAVAKKYARNYILIELNPAYKEIAEKRLSNIEYSLFLQEGQTDEN